MSYVDEMEQRFIEFRDNLDNHAMSVIESSDPQIVEHVQKQLMEGKDGNDNYIKPYALEEYAEYKRTLNPLGVTDWKLTGDFYAHMRLRIIDSSRFEVFSTGENTLSLILNYGRQQMEEAMKMSDESVEEFQEQRFHPFMVDLIAAYTGASTTRI